ncbi:MAG: SusC/RagA family TonB-linked outer membrane protein [Prevotella sp.]
MTNKQQFASWEQAFARFLRLPVMALLLTMVCGELSAQTISVKGVVKDSQGEPVIGASVVPQGNTAAGTITDINGDFTVKAGAKDTIVVTYIGFKPYKFVGKPNHLQNVVLEDEATAVEEVVVVAYGTQKKATVTGSVAAADPKELRKSAAANFENQLSGRITGLTTMQSGGGQPGRDGGTMYLRGVATVNGNSPLILIDGVTYDNVSGNVISEIDPNEVESVSVLKDASATAVFGVRGANGVILINTRRGKEGKPNLSINFQQSFTSFSRTDERIHSWEYMELKNEALRNDGMEPQYSDELIAKFRNPLANLDRNDPDYAAKAAALRYMYCDHDWLSETFKSATPQTKINANVSGGTDQFKYFMNVGYIHQGGNLKTESKDQLGYDSSSWMDRWNFRANMDYQVTRDLKAGLNLGSSIQTTNMPSADVLYGGDENWMMSDLFYNAQILLPMQPGPVTLAGYGVPSGAHVQPPVMDRSPFEVMNRYGFRQRTDIDFTGQFTLDLDLSRYVTKGLSIKGQVNYHNSGRRVRDGRKREATYTVLCDYENDTFSYTINNPNPEALRINTSTSSLFNINAQASINYNRTFAKKHAVTGMFLAQRDYWNSNEAEIPYNVIGFCGRATYAFDDRYLAEVNVGYNGSEQFAPDKRFGFFPAFSLGWIVSNEKFMKDLTWLDNLKLRYSNGTVGNDKLGTSRFLYQSNIQTSGTSYVGGLGTSAIRSITQGLLGNSQITWEKAHKQNFGVDVKVLDCLSLSVDVFNEKRRDILISRHTIPAFQGVSLSNLPKVNMGRMKNHGFEVELGFEKDLTKDLHMSFKGNFATNDNRVTFYDEAQRTEDYVHRYRTQGYRYGQCWGYKIDYSKNGGYYVSQEDIDADGLKYSFGTPRPGDFRYMDLNGDGTIDSKDQVPIKYSSIPGITYGFNIGFSYKGFDFSCLFSGLGRYSKSYSGQGVYENVKHGYYFNYQRTAWTPERWANGEKITYPALTTKGSSISQQPNDFFIQDRSFLRLKNIELGYTLPKQWLAFAGVKSCHLYVSGMNLFCWDHLKTDHLDPEQDNPYGYPITKMVSFGCNVNF